MSESAESAISIQSKVHLKSNKSDNYCGKKAEVNTVKQMMQYLLRSDIKLEIVDI